MNTKSLVEIKEATRVAGSQWEGYGYRVGDYRMMHHIDELPEFVNFLQNKQFDLGLFIGIGTGGMLRFLTENVKFNKVIVVEIGISGHSEFSTWYLHRPHVKAEVIDEIITDSTHEPVKFALNRYVNKVDFAYIDALHTYKNVKNDTELALSVMKSGGLLCFHDIQEVADVRKYYSEIRDLPKFKVAFEIRRHQGIAALEVL